MKRYWKFPAFLALVLVLGSCEALSSLLGGVTPSLDSPTGLSAQAGDGEVLLTWTGVSGADSYLVYRKTGTGLSTSSNDGTTSSLLASVTVTGLANGTAYSFMVVAIKGATNSAPSALVFATPVAALPPAPTGLSATGGVESASLTWTEVNGATSYNVYYKADSTTAAVTDSKAHPSMISGSTALVTGLTGGTSYAFIVTAIQGGVEGLPSEATTATAEVAPLSRPATRVYYRYNSTTGQLDARYTDTYLYPSAATSLWTARVRSYLSGTTYRYDMIRDPLGRRSYLLYWGTTGGSYSFSDYSQSSYDQDQDSNPSRIDYYSSTLQLNEYATYLYNPSRQQTACRYYDNLDALLDATTYDYGTDGRETGGTYSDGTSTYTIFSEVNAAGKITRRDYRDATGTLFGSDLFTYDAKGNKLSSTYEWTDGVNIVPTTREEYVYEDYVPDPFTWLSNDPMLTSLTINGSELFTGSLLVNYPTVSPGSITFDLGTRTDATLLLTAAAHESHAAMTLDGSALVGSPTLTLASGLNTFTIQVTAQDGVSTWDWVIKVNH